MSTLQFYLFIIPLVVGIGILTTQAWRDDMFRRKKNVAELTDAARDKRIAEARLPDGHVMVRTWQAGEDIAGDLDGSLMLFGSGTYGLNMLVRVLMFLYLCGMQRVVGSILLIENNKALRDGFLQQIDPCFHDRVVLGFAETWAGGAANSTITEVMNAIDEWGGEIARASRQVVDLHRRRNSCVPAQIIFYWGEGGQAPFAVAALPLLHKEFHRAQIVCMTSLADHRRNRTKFAEMKTEFDKPSYGIKGYIVSDEFDDDFRNADTCMAALVVALYDAQLRDDTATQYNNVLTQAFTQQPGSILTLQYVLAELPAWEWLVEEKRVGYFTNMQWVTSTVQTALRDIEEGRARQAVRAQLGEPGTAVYDIVMTNLGYDQRHERDDLQALAERIEDGYKHRLDRYRETGGREQSPGFLYKLMDYGLKFGSLAGAVDHVQPKVIVIAMRLAAIQNGTHGAEELIKVPEQQLLPHNRMLTIDAGKTVAAALHATLE